MNNCFKLNNIIRDAGIIFSNLKYLPVGLIASEVSDIKFRNEYSEIDLVTKSAVSVIRTVYNVVMGPYIKYYELDLNLKDEDDTHWFFINGITSTRDIVSLNELALEKIFGVEFSTLYNPTHGLVADVLECILERTIDKQTVICTQLYEIIEDLMDNGKKIRIITHSQGGIIASTFLKIMKDSGKTFKDVEIYSFASAADEDIDVPGVYQEHFFNEKDFVSRIGLMNVKTKGDSYILKNMLGHLLNRDYLEHFKEGKYCKGKSRLFKYTLK